MMDMTLTERAKRIAAEWFPHHVAKHTTTTLEGGGTMERLRWAKPETGIYAVDYICWHGTLFVAGDIGLAAYRWSDNVNLAQIAGFDYQYFEEKCEASPEGRSFKEWNSDEVLRHITQHLAELEDPEAVERIEGSSWRSAVYSQEEWTIFLATSGDVFGHDWWEWTATVGLRVHGWCIGHLVGLKLVFERDL